MSVIEQEIQQARRALENTLQVPDILSRMSSFGYNTKRLRQGKALVEKTAMLHRLKKDKYDERQHLSFSLQADTKTCRLRYMEHVKVTRQAFAWQPGIQRQLEIDRPVPSALSKWLLRAHTFYLKLEEVHGQMERYIIALEEIGQARAMVESILAQREQRLRKKVEAECTTHSRNMAKKEMRGWMHDFYSIARVALKNNPQLLEALGMVVPAAKM